MNTRSSYCYFFLFAALWCLAMTMGTDRSVETHDAVSFRQQFEYMRNSGETFFDDLARDFVKYDENARKDIYATAVIRGITRLTGNYHVMFLVFGVVCSFFMLKTFRFFTGERAFDNSFPALLLAAIFIMHNDIWQIWGVRFITATWIALYASFQVLRNERKKYLLLLCLTPLIHAAFWGVVLLFFLALLVARFKMERLWRVFFVIGIFVAPFALTLVKSGIPWLPENLRGPFSSYVDPDYVREISAHFDGRVIFSRVLLVAQELFTMFIVLLFMIYRERITSRQDYNIYLLLLVISTFAAFTTSIPSLGERFFRLTYPLIAYLFLKYFNHGRFRLLLYIYPLVFLHHFYMSLGIYYWTTHSWEFYLSSPFYTIYKYLIAFQA
jgi:hypothetical protein